jgi:hypothetical protein
MMKMHEGGKSPADNPVMKDTHQLAEAQLKVMGLLEQMSSASGRLEWHWKVQIS